MADDSDRPADDLPQRWMWMLKPEGFAAHPEVNAVVKEGKMLDGARAKEIARDMIAYLHDYLPRVVAVRDVVRAIEESYRTLEATAGVVLRADEVVLADPSSFLTADHEIAHRATRIMRKLVDERKLTKPEEVEAIAPECYQRARQAMGDRAAQVTHEPQDPLPLAFLQLRGALFTVGQWFQYAEQAAAMMKFCLDLGPYPYQTGGRPSLDFAMYLAWLLQDTGKRSVPDHHVVNFLEAEAAKLPSDIPFVIPKVTTVAEWRRTRAKIPGLCPRKKISENPK